MDSGALSREQLDELNKQLDRSCGYLRALHERLEQCRFPYDILAKWAAKYPEGPCFRNRNKEPWRANNFACRFYRLEKKIWAEYLAEIQRRIPVSSRRS